jgi:integrase
VPSTPSTYLHFAGFLAARLGRIPEPADLTEAALLDFRDGLEAAGRARATVAKELSALGRLAAALETEGVDPAAQRVRANAVGRRVPRAVTRAELERLLAMPDRRTRRDLAIMLLLGQAGLRRAESARFATETSTSCVATPTRAGGRHSSRRVGSSTSATPTRGRARAVDLTAKAVEALRAWTQSRPESATDHLASAWSRLPDLAQSDSGGGTASLEFKLAPGVVLGRGPQRQAPAAPSCTATPTD